MEALERVEVLTGPFRVHAYDWADALRDLVEQFQSAEPAPTRPSPRSLRAWAGRLRDTMAPSVASLTASTDAIREDWAAADAAMSNLAVRSSELPRAQRAEVREQLAGMARSTSFDTGTDLDELRAQMAGLGQAARQLRPLARSFTAALDVMSQIRTSASGWVTALD